MADLRAYNPSLRERIMWGIAGKAGDWFGAGRYAQQDIAKKVGGLIDFVPGAGDAVGVDDAYRDYQAGNYGLAAAGLGLTALGAVPGVGDAAATGVKKGIRAFHGSPHDFDRFDLSKIGTGEGAQAYGHGLYFAEAEDVARSYRDALSRQTSYDGMPVSSMHPSDSPQAAAISSISKYVADGQDAADAIAREAASWRASAQPYLDFAVENPALADTALEHARSFTEVADAVEKLNPAKFSKNTGRMYEVNINADPEAFLDFDAPIGKQPQGVRDFLSQYGATGDDRLMSNALQQVDITRGDGRMSGFSPKTSEELRARGVPGIKFLDQISRGAGDGSRNYVVFDDSIIEIVKKYGIAGALGAGLISQEMAAQMQAQGIEEL